MSPHERDKLIEALALARLQLSGISMLDAITTLEGMSRDQFRALPEFMLVSIFQDYAAMRTSGAPVPFCLAALEQKRAPWVTVNDIPAEATIEQYIGFRIEIEHADADIAPSTIVSMVDICASKLQFVEPLDEISLTMALDDPKHPLSFEPTGAALVPCDRCQAVLRLPPRKLLKATCPRCGSVQSVDTFPRGQR